VRAARRRMLRPMSHRVFADLESDTAEAAALAFTRLAVDYFETTRRGRGPVSTPLAPEDIERRFDEPLPREGRPLAGRGGPRRTHGQAPVQSFSGASSSSGTSPPLYSIAQT